MKQVIALLSIVLFVAVGVFAEVNTPVGKYHRKPENFGPKRDVKPTPPPRADEAISPAEFSRAYGAYLSWTNDAVLQVVTKDIALEVTKDDTLYMAVAIGQDTPCQEYFNANQVNMDRVKFVFTDTINLSMWIRDFGPFYFYEDGLRAISNYYYWYAEYDTFPHIIANHWGFNCYDAILMLSGGNFMTDGNGMGFVASVVEKENKTWNVDSIHNNLKQYLGLDSVVVIRSMQNDGTGHIDMAQKILNDTLIIVGEYLNPGDGYGQNQMILNNNADSLAKQKNLDGRSFNVVRIPMPPYYQVGTDSYTPSYTNSLILNRKVLVPIYGDSLASLDTQALNIYKELMPDYQVIGINSAEIIKHWGAVHCISKTHFHHNPMMVLHDQLDTINVKDTPVVAFRLNPGFDSLSGSVFYKPKSGADFTEVAAVLDKGIFSATLPNQTEDFNYYISGLAKSGDQEFPATYPDDAPTSTLLTVVLETSIYHTILANNFVKLSNYPNPFNGRTTISYTVKKKSNILLDVYNIRGRKVCTIAKGFHKAGSYQKVWHGKSSSGEQLSSGMYYLVTTITNDAVGTVSKKKEIVIIR